MTLEAVLEDGAFLVRDGDVELLRYVFLPDAPTRESPKPYIDPIRTRSGRVVSLFRPWDHVWHKGLSWSLPVVDEENFWGGPSYVHGEGYVQQENNGAQEHREVVFAGRDGQAVRFAHSLEWRTQSGRLLFVEQRQLTVVLLGARAWALTIDLAMTNVSGAEIRIGSPTTKGRENAGYGGLFWRGPRSFTGGVFVTDSGIGSGNDVRGGRYPWMGFEGRHDIFDGTSLIVMVDAADNIRHPPQWFARSEEFAALCPAPFFAEEVPVAAEEALRLRYAVGIADGVSADAAPLAAELRALL